MKAAELLVRCLENENVEFIFGLPGEENLDVMDACSTPAFASSACATSRAAPSWPTSTAA